MSLPGEMQKRHAMELELQSLRDVLSVTEDHSQRKALKNAIYALHDSMCDQMPLPPTVRTRP